jgi:hypothetical protein
MGNGKSGSRSLAGANLQDAAEENLLSLNAVSLRTPTPESNSELLKAAK